MKGFSVSLPLKDRGYFLHHEDSDEFHRIVQIHLSGEFLFTQDEMAFTVAQIGTRVYGSGRGQLLGRDVVWVGTTDVNAQKTTISWKALNSADEESADARANVAEQRLPGLLEITPPAEWVDQEVEDGILHVAQSAGGDDAALTE